jgi:hypothetical protein
VLVIGRVTMHVLPSHFQRRLASPTYLLAQLSRQRREKNDRRLEIVHKNDSSEFIITHQSTAEKPVKINGEV